MSATAVHDHTSPAHHKDDNAPCCCCGARWEPIKTPGHGNSMVHADDCQYLADST